MVVVWGEVAGWSWLAGGSVVPDCCGEREKPLEDPGADPFGLTSAVSFEVELCFEGLVHRLDDLTERLQEPSAWSLFLAFASGSDQGDALGVQLGFERC